jgi:hypothetical protein
MTHKAAVRRMAEWLRLCKGYSVVISELSSRNMETPDVLAFKDGHHSMLIECKVSRADFLSDKTKAFRAYPEMGVGDNRYYASLPGIIKVTDLPAGWGLLEIHDRQIRTIKDSDFHKASKSAEVTILVSALRRLSISTAVYVMAEEPESQEVAA